MFCAKSSRWNREYKIAQKRVSIQKASHSVVSMDVRHACVLHLKQSSMPATTMPSKQMKCPKTVPPFTTFCCYQS